MEEDHFTTQQFPIRKPGNGKELTHNFRSQETPRGWCGSGWQKPILFLYLPWSGFFESPLVAVFVLPLVSMQCWQWYIIIGGFYSESRSKYIRRCFNSVEFTLAKWHPRSTPVPLYHPVVVYIWEMCTELEEGAEWPMRKRRRAISPNK